MSGFDTAKSDSDPISSVATCPESHCTFPVDLLLRSKDGSAIGAHAQLLAAATEGFPFPSTHITLDACDVVELPEDQDVLQMIMKFVHPQRPPKCDKLNPDLLVRLAEAVEKYGVYSAMEVCRLLMGQISAEIYPLEVLLYAARHLDDNELMEAAAASSVFLDVGQAWKKLRASQDLYVAWTIYSAERRSAGQKLIVPSIVNPTHYRSKSGKTVDICETWTSDFEASKADWSLRPPVTMEEFRSHFKRHRCLRCWGLWETKAFGIFASLRSFEDIRASLQE